MWLGAMMPLLAGGTVVTISKLGLDPHLIWNEVERNRCTGVTIVGDAFAKPMLEALNEAKARGNPYDISSLQQIVSSGVMWSAEVKASLLEHQDMTLLDTMGSTEGGLGTSVATRDNPVETARFKINSGVRVFTDDGRDVEPGSGKSECWPAAALRPSATTRTRKSPPRRSRKSMASGTASPATGRR